MMKKITSFLTMLVMLFMSIGASAQAEDFGLKTVSIGTAIDSFTPNTWYFFHQGRVSGGGDGLCDIGAVPSMGGIMTDMGIGKNLIKRSLDDVPANSLASDKVNYLVRFIPAEEQNEANDIYTIQFGSGNYLCAPNGTGDSKTITTTDNVYDAGKYNIYFIEDETAPGHIGINVCDSRGSYQEMIDNNGVNQTIVTWSSGKKTSAVGSNSTWSIIEVVWGEVEEREAAWNQLKEVLAEYEPLIATITPGTLPGQYDEELLNAFKNCIQQVKDLDNDPETLDSMTADDFRALAQAIKDAYDAVIASKVPVTLADGYYRIKSGMEFYTETTDPETLETVKTIYDKYMFSHNNGNGTFYGNWGTPDDLTTDATALWKLTNTEDGYFDIVNMGTDARFNNVARSTNVTMTVPGDKLLALDPATTIDGTTYVNIRISSQNGGDGLYLHTGGHESGAGISGNLVGWYSTVSEDGVAGSEWMFLPVSDEEALAVIDAYAPIKDHELMLARYDSILTEAKANLEIAKDEVSEALITANSQFSSPWTEASEGSLNNLLDGNTNTFWHSAWSNGEVEGHTHYLQVALNEALDKEIFLAFSRRTSGGTPVAYDHITVWSIYGSSDPEAADEVWTELTSLETPYSSSEINMTTEPFSTQGYQYLRFYADATTTGRGYWHIGEFQLYTVPEENPNSQFSHMGDLGTNLEKVINDQAEMDLDDITIDEYNALKAAYDAFMTKFVDPTELRQVLKDKADVAGSVVEGTQPGFWAPGSDAAKYTSLYDEAKAYDEKGDYTPEKSKDYVTNLTEGADNLFASAIGIQEGKWYKIRFATEEEFDQYGWDKVAGNGTEDGKIETLFGKYATVCSYSKDEEGYEIHEAIENEEIEVGQGVYFDDEIDINDPDMALFRFVNVGDSAYQLQHKASGLFIKAYGSSGAVSLSAHPTLFRVRAIGYGENVISATNINGDYESNLHAQVSGNTLVTWDVDYPGSRSGLYIEEAEDVAADYDGTEFNIFMQDGGINTWCFPVEVSVVSDNAQMWGVNSVEGTTVNLCKIDKAEGGRPFILVCGDLEDYDPENEELETVVLRHEYNITGIEPQNSGFLKGTYTQKTVGTGVIIANGNVFEVSKRSTTAVGANGAYIESEEALALDAAITANWDETAVDGIDHVANTQMADGKCYDLTGRRVEKVQRGIYIRDGKKFVVK